MRVERTRRDSIDPVADLIWVLVGLIVVSLLLYAVATIVFGPGEPTPPSGQPLARALPHDRPLTGDDVRGADLPVAVRGYRMREVDALLRRLADELDQAQRTAAAERDDVAQPAADSQTEATGDDPLDADQDTVRDPLAPQPPIPQPPPFGAV